MRFDLSGQFKAFTDFSVDGKVFLGLGSLDLGKLGEVDLKTGIDGEFKAGYNGHAFEASITGGFEIGGHSFNFPAFQLDIQEKQFEDVGALATFLCSENAGQMTGSSYSIDGGWTAI